MGRTAESSAFRQLPNSTRRASYVQVRISRVPCRLILRQVKGPSPFARSLESTRPHSRGAVRARALRDRLPSIVVRAQGRPGGRMHPGFPRKNELRERVNQQVQAVNTGPPCAVVYGLISCSPVNQRLPPSPVFRERDQRNLQARRAQHKERVCASPHSNSRRAPARRYGSRISTASRLVLSADTAKKKVRPRHAGASSYRKSGRDQYFATTGPSQWNL